MAMGDPTSEANFLGPMVSAAQKSAAASARSPERLTLAHQQQLTHHEFLELLLADEVTRDDSRSALLRANTAGSIRPCCSILGTTPRGSSTTT